ncbi:hypothetical protein [Actinomycetospora lemnae]|uniref:Uncharacterized protein n=1 Tax=Actinomycetospora lemnae TaxID=3019891 RepID=A0ABT5T1B8_9PSEU|nr:hypothetical protein [Actinomycetospora sp. DW7H6]MDD7968495.1 hypothetical protein [Actinomycetospora sp. DW7H6]
MNNETQMMDDIVAEARADWIDMGHAIGIVSLDEGGDDDLALLRRAAGLVTQLVREGRLIPGDIGTEPGAFIPWPSSREDSARYLEEYVDQVVGGAKPFEPWQPCMFAAG